MRSLLAALAADAPLVVVLDDLHWADQSSIDLIAALLRRPPAAEVMLALAFRHRQASERLVAAVDRAEREGRTVSVRLAPLDAETASALLGADLPASTRELLFLESGGNPFYLEHLARSARSADAADADGRAALPGVPRAVSAALADELRRVTGATRTVLDAAAVIGVDFDPETVAAVAEVAPEVVIDALDELVAADLMRPSIHPRRFTIRHPLVRRAIYDTTGAGWRLLAHERAAASLRSRGEASETLAHHVAVSARVGDEDAIGVLLDAAFAVHVAAPASAARWIADAIELMPPEAAERRREWMVQLAAAQAAAGQVAHARDDVARRARPGPPDAVAERVRLTVRSVGLDRLLGRHHDGHERLIRTLAALPGEATDEHALLYVTLAVDSFHRAELADMVSWGERAIAAGRERSAHAVTATGLAVVAFAAALTGDTARARDLCDEAAALFERLSDEELATSLEAAQFLGLLEMYIERFAAAAGHARRGIEAARATGNAQMVPVLAVPLGYSTAMLGQLDESRAVLEGAIEQERLVDSRFAAVWVLMNAGVTAWLAGDLARSRAAATEVLEALADMDETIVTGNAKSVLGIIELEERRFQAAVDLFLEAGGGPELPLIGGFWRVMVLEALAEAELGCGRPRLAQAAADVASAAAETLQLDLPHAVALRAHATLALREGDSERAAELALEAVERAGAHRGAHRDRAHARRSPARPWPPRAAAPRP